MPDSRLRSRACHPQAEKGGLRNQTAVRNILAEDYVESENKIRKERSGRERLPERKRGENRRRDGRFAPAPDRLQKTRSSGGKTKGVD